MALQFKQNENHGTVLLQQQPGTIVDHGVALAGCGWRHKCKHLQGKVACSSTLAHSSNHAVLHCLL